MIPNIEDKSENPLAFRYHGDMAVAPSPNQTKAERVYKLLWADILSGRLPPGSRLRYAELQEKYETSTGVLREAMLRLSEQGLVKGEPQQGFQVVDLTVEDLQDLSEARVALETLALRYAMAEGDIDWESRLIAAHHRLSRTPLQDPDDPDRLNEDWVGEHAAFHQVLLDGCGNRRIKSIANSLRESAELYRRWSLPLGRSTDRNVHHEHDQILAAVLEHDTERAVTLLTDHITLTSNILLQASVSEAAPK
jgi:DNA-binding GntR family transcriptional regulator